MNPCRPGLVERGRNSVDFRPQRLEIGLPAGGEKEILAIGLGQADDFGAGRLGVAACLGVGHVLAHRGDDQIGCLHGRSGDGGKLAAMVAAGLDLHKGQGRSHLADRDGQRLGVRCGERIMEDQHLHLRTSAAQQPHDLARVGEFHDCGNDAHNLSRIVLNGSRKSAGAQRLCTPHPRIVDADGHSPAFAIRSNNPSFQTSAKRFGRSAKPSWNALSSAGLSSTTFIPRALASFRCAASWA